MLNALDLETESLDPSMQLHAALEPWRVRQGKARISSLSVAKSDGSVVRVGSDPKDIEKVLKDLEGQVVYGHNVMFDVAWLIATLQPERTGAIPDVIRNIQWRDTGLLIKWVINGQLPETNHFSYSLANLVSVFLKDHPMTPEFVKMKTQNVEPGKDSAYWELRGDMDAIMTLELAKKFQTILPGAQRKGFLVEQACIVPVANSWIVGIRIDQNQLAINEKHFAQMKTEAAKKLGVSEDIFTSTKRLPDLLYNVWGLPVIKRTPTGNPACDADTLKLLHYKLLQEDNKDLADKLSTIMEAKSSSTIISKYVSSMREALQHTRDGYIYPSPRIFGTYTGRMTYSNTTLGKNFDTGKGKKFKCSIAAHQIPRKDKMIRSALCPPPGYVIYEADASGQESRLMALRSNDQTMLSIFQRDINFHSFTGASIIGKDYTDFQYEFNKEGNDGGYYTEQRQLGKLTNLSCNYRIGGKALSEKAFANYDTFMTVDTGNFLVKTFVRTYPGVKKYWDDVIWESKAKGFTETFGGRRYKLTDWNNYRWATESSAINVPIQGAGADMKCLAIKETYEKVPEFIFCLDLHDATFGYIKEELAEEVHKKLDEVLNNVDYQSYWGFKLAIDLPYESKRGYTWAEVK